MELIDSNHSQLLSRALDVYALRHRITAANIANIDTPGYNRHEVRFEDELRKIQESEGVQGMKNVSPRIVETDGDVVLENELLKMADTQIRVQVVTRALRHHFNLLKTGITGVNR